jgi:hypothetical protein
MKYYKIIENKIISEVNENYICQEDETKLPISEMEWKIKKRTNGQFFEINRNEKLENDIEVGAVTKFKVKRGNENIIIPISEKLQSDQIIDFIQYPEKMKVYRGGSSIICNGDEFDCNTEAIEHKYTKDELYINNGKAEIKTPEMQVVEIRNKARIKLLEMKNKINEEEKKKIQLTEIDDWTSGDEAKLTDMNDDYDNAVSDYDNIKTQLMQNIGNEVNFNAKKIELKDTFAKYNIKV